MTRREFFGMASVGAVALAIAGRIAINSGQGGQQQGGFRIQHTEAEWQVRLSPASFDVLRKGATEHPFSSPLLDEHRNGIFACAGCDQAAFSSATKFDSHTGWPSFWQSLPAAIIKRPDFTLARLRTEVLCSACGGHLGHVFDDGPPPTGLRFCMNGAALAFHPKTT